MPILANLPLSVNGYFFTIILLHPTPEDSPLLSLFFPFAQSDLVVLQPAHDDKIETGRLILDKSIFSDE